MSLTKVTYPMIEGAPLYLESFGVVADGTDQLAKINAAFAYLNSSTIGRITTSITGEICVSDVIDMTAANKELDFPCTFKTLNPTTAVNETVRIAGNNCVVNRLFVDRNRANTVWDGSFGTQPGVRFGSGSGILVKSLVVKNSMDEGVSIQNTDGLLIESLKVENAGEHGVYISADANNVTINQYTVDGYGNAGHHSVVAAVKCAPASGIVNNVNILSGSIDDGGATGGVSKFVIETDNTNGLNFKSEVIDCDQVFNVVGGTSGSYNHTYEFNVQGCRVAVCATNATGVTRNIAIKNSLFPNKAFSKFGMFSLIENTQFLGSIRIDSGHDANVSGRMVLNNVIAASIFEIAKDYLVSATGCSFNNIDIGNSSTVSLTLDSCSVSVASDDAINASAGTTVNVYAISSTITGTRYGFNGPIYLYPQNSVTSGGSGRFSGGAQYAVGQTTVSAVTSKAALQLASYYLWVDATGDLRIKPGAPTSDTDGTVVGTQT
jgi:hypothetical protein